MKTSMCPLESILGFGFGFFDLFDIGVVVFSFMIANKVTQAVPMRGFFL